MLKNCYHQHIIGRSPLITTKRLFASKIRTIEKDLVVIGGGSGGLACAKEAAEFGKKVAVLDLVTPSPQGTRWEIGGTCVNVGCIPKKLMHQAAILGHSIQHSSSYGWKIPQEKPIHDWSTLSHAVQLYIKSLNWGHRVQLNEKDIQYVNGRGSFVDQHTIKSINKKGKEILVKSENFVIAVGGRPSYPDVPGAKEFCITSDDIFWMKKSPGKTLVIGGSYVGLECAGFITGLNLDCDVMIRSIPLRGFDQQIAEMLVKNMEINGTKILRESTPIGFNKREEDDKIEVLWENLTTRQQFSGIYDTVLLATGRRADTDLLGLENIGLESDPSDGKLYVDEKDCTKISNIFAIGDVAKGRPELTPVAAKSGRMLSQRLYGDSDVIMDYVNIPTTVYTPIEYGCVGLNEEDAEAEYGADNIEIYHAHYKPLEFNLPQINSEQCYIKVICKRDDDQQVIGIHFVGPHAGEVIQGFACAIKNNLTYKQLISTIGIHPTCAEEIVRVNITKRSGKDPAVTGC